MTVEDLLKKCEDLYLKHDYTELIRTCDEILIQDRTNPIAMNYKAFSYYTFGQYHLALKILNKVHELYPDNYYAYNNRAMVYMDQKEYEKALECCEKGLEIKRFDWLEENKVKTLISLDRIDEAYKFYSTIDEPGFTFNNALISCGKFSELPRFNEGLPDDIIVFYLLQRCKDLENKREYEELLETCDEILKLDKDKEIALSYKIHALGFLERDDEIIKLADYAMKLYPNNYRFPFAKAQSLLWEYEDYDGAIENYEKGLAITGDFDKFWFQVDELITALEKKADQLVESQKYEKALETYNKMLFYKPYEFKAIDKIDSIVEEHDVSYDYSENYKKSLKLRQESRERAKKIENCVNRIEIGEYDEDYIKELDKFKDYNSIDEYIRDLIIYLMESYPRRSEESARFLVRCNMAYVKSSYEAKEPVAYSSIEVGYCCG